MTTVVSRLYDGADTAGQVAAQLMELGFPDANIDVIAAGNGAADAMRAARVDSNAAETYASHLDAKRSMLVVRAPFNPIGAAKTAIEIADAAGPVDAGVANENAYVTETPSKRYFLSVLTDHPRYFSSDMVPGSGRYRTRFSSAFGMKLLSEKKRRNSVYSGGKLFMTKSLSTKPRKKSVTRSRPILSEAMNMPTLMMHNRV